MNKKRPGYLSNLMIFFCSILSISSNSLNSFLETQPQLMLTGPIGGFPAGAAPGPTTNSFGSAMPTNYQGYSM